MYFEIRWLAAPCSVRPSVSQCCGVEGSRQQQHKLPHPPRPPPLVVLGNNCLFNWILRSSLAISNGISKQFVRQLINNPLSLRYTDPARQSDPRGGLWGRARGFTSTTTTITEATTATEEKPESLEEHQQILQWGQITRNIRKVSHKSPTPKRICPSVGRGDGRRPGGEARSKSWSSSGSSH